MPSLANPIDYSQKIKLKLTDIAQLIKFRLSSMVVFSTAVGYIVAQNDGFGFSFFLLLLSGFMITGSANGINQLIEKDLDSLMTRTHNRPIAQNRIGIQEAIAILSILGFTGVFLLGNYFNFLAAIIGGISLLIYAFVYTPLKQKTNLSVWIGAVSGAAPPLIGYVAASGKIDSTALLLFAFQFVWQLPHFWALAWVLNDDYNKAGFYLLPDKKGRTKKSAFITLLASLVLIPLQVVYYYFGNDSLWINMLLLGLTSNYIFQAFRLYRQTDLKAARQLMFGSFYYLPLIQIVFILNTII